MEDYLHMKYIRPVDFDLTDGNSDKERYLKAFGVKFEIPTAEVLNATIVDKGSCIEIVKYVFPSEHRTQVKIEPQAALYERLNEEGNIIVRVRGERE